MLIVDAGGTSTTWCLCEAGMVSQKLTTAGINAVVSTSEQISNAVQEASALVQSAGCIYFYGAGCVGIHSGRVLAELKRCACEDCRIEIDSDLLGAARALFRCDSGIACILGTGSNSCYYNGTSIAAHVPPLGFILGDEGSGAALGKALTVRVLRGDIADANLLGEFHSFVGANTAEVIDRIYRHPGANHLLASLAPILYRYQHLPECKDIVTQEFNRFFNAYIIRYSDCPHGGRIGFIGSLASAFMPVLRSVCAHYGFEEVTCEASPINGLVNYHSNNI